MATSPDSAPVVIQPAPIPRPRRSLRRFFVRGLILLLPTIITVWILAKVVGFLQSSVVQYVCDLVAWIFWLAGAFPGYSYKELPELDKSVVIAIAWVLSIAFVLFIGLVFGGWLGIRLWRSVERFFVRFPVIRFIYPHVRQVTDFVFDPERKLQFNQVVAVQWPRPGVYAIGFVTGKALSQVSQAAGTDCLTVFIPHSPTPVTGFIAFIPRDETIFLPISMDQAFKLIMSGGVISPEGIAQPAQTSIPSPPPSGS